MDFSIFKDKLQKYYDKQNIKTKIPSEEFLTWFIGFSEGDGSFVVNKRNQLSFILIQGTANLTLLENILKELPLGHIIKQSLRVYRLIVQKKDEVELIIYLFNGNIVLPSRKIQFKKFISTFLLKNKDKSIEYLNNRNFPIFGNTWLLGFVEAEGCFTISLLSNSNAFRTRFIVSQKGDINLPILSQLILIFETGFIEGHHVKDNYSYVVSGLKNIFNIYKYFDKYLNNFQGIKKESYLKFKQVNQMLSNQDHLNIELRKSLKTLAEDINSANRKFK